MGMDFITAGLWIKPGVQVKFEAGKQAVLALSDNELTAVAGQAGLIDGETVEEIREYVNGLIDTLKEALDVDREFALWVTPDQSFHLWITGGMSGGDSPTEAYDAITDLYEAPSVLKALGFHVEAGQA